MILYVDKATRRHQPQESNMFTTTKKTYSWGTLRTVRCGNSYTCVIHPEDWETLCELADGESTVFLDEQGMYWRAARTDDEYVLTSGSYVLTTPVEDLP